MHGVDFLESCLLNGSLILLQKIFLQQFKMELCCDSDAFFSFIRLSLHLFAFGLGKRASVKLFQLDGNKDP